MFLSVFLAGCAASQIAGQVESGRRSLLVNAPERALPYLLDAAKGDPNYVYEFDLFRESVWTYLGRSQYETKKYADARQSLERALALDKDEHLARLYLGLTLTRLGDAASGVGEIQNAMKGIHDWLDYTERTQPFDAYWDPGREIRKNIIKDLNGGSPAKEVSRDQLIAAAEWLGKRIEEEVEYVRRDRREDRKRTPFGYPANLPNTTSGPLLSALSFVYPPTSSSKSAPSTYNNSLTLSAHRSAPHNRREESS